MERMRLVLLVALLPALCPPARADRLVTTDGRILTVKKARKLPDGNFQLTFANGDVLCPAACIQTIEIEGDMSDYVPQNEDERKRLEQGFVRYRGRWMSKPAYIALLDKEASERRARIEELAAHSAFQNAYVRESEHFLLRTNSSPELADYYSSLLETYYDLMDRRLGINPTPTLSRLKIPVNIYKNYDDFLLNNAAGAGYGVGGYFDPYRKTLNFFHDAEDPGLSNWVGLHEGTHLLTYLIEPQTAPEASAVWVNEGIADFFGSAEVRVDPKGKLEILPGKLQIERILTVQQAVKRDAYVPLEKLFHLTQAEFSAFEYAHAWSFIYFLNNSTKQYEAGFKRFFRDFYTIPKNVQYSFEPDANQQGTSKIIPSDEVRRLLLESLKVKDVGALEKEWIAFISKIEINAPDALFKRAYGVVTRGQTEDFEQAMKDIEAAMAAGYLEPGAYWLRGMLRSWLSKTDLRAGLVDLRKAVELAPLSATYRFDLGEALAGYTLFTGSYRLRITIDNLRGSDSEIEEARQQLSLACELDPENDTYREGLKEFLERYERWKAEGTSGK
jgi:hypothetical protein